jgi:hypothetical protein
LGAAHAAQVVGFANYVIVASALVKERLAVRA